MSDPNDQTDTHEPAIDAQGSPGADSATHEDGDEDDGPAGAPGAPGGALPEHDPIYRRTVSGNTRALFAKAAKALEATLGADDMDVAIDVAIDGPGQDGAAAAAPAPAPAPAPDPSPALAAPSPAVVSSHAPTSAAPAPAPIQDRLALDLELRAKALDEREKALALTETERTKALEARAKELEGIASIGTRYLERGADEIADQIRQWTGAESDEDMTAEVTSLIAQLSEKYLKIPVDPSIQQATSQRRALQKVRAHSLELERKQHDLDTRLAREREAELKRREDDLKAAEARRLEAEQKANDELARRRLAHELSKGTAEDGVPWSAKFPHLMAEESPNDIVMDVVHRKAHLEPAWAPNWVEAAQIAEKFYRGQHETLYKRVSPLFTPAKPPTAAPASSSTAHQGAPAQGRGARTLTNGAVAPLPPAQPRQSDPPQPAEPEVYDPRAHRTRSLAQLKVALAKRQTTEA